MKRERTESAPARCCAAPHAHAVPVKFRNAERQFHVHGDENTRHAHGRSQHLAFFDLVDFG